MGDAAEGDHHLPWVGEEVRRVAAVYGQTPDLLIDPERDRPRNFVARELRSPLDVSHTGVSVDVLTRIADARVLHLACHGFAPASGSEVPELYLAGSLTFDALETRRLTPGACVVLSACSVGGSHGEAPLAQVGFPGILLAVGARSVIASTWPILDCEKTVDFMVEVHRGLAGGASAKQALDRACRWAKSERLPSVIYAGFDVYGQ